jgi:hypothetical protein
MGRGNLEKIFYLVSILGALVTVIWALSGWGSLTQANADDVKQLKSQYSEIIVRLTRIEDALKNIGN